MLPDTAITASSLIKEAVSHHRYWEYYYLNRSHKILQLQESHHFAVFCYLVLFPEIIPAMVTLPTVFMCFHHHFISLIINMHKFSDVTVEISLWFLHIL